MACTVWCSSYDFTRAHKKNAAMIAIRTIATVSGVFFSEFIRCSMLFGE